MNEKTFIFGPIIIFFAFFLLLIIGFLALVLKLVFKGKKDAWVGVVVDKIHNTYRDFDSDDEKDLYTLVFNTTTGRQVKYGTTKLIYDDYSVGDKAEKISGKFHIQKLK